jgi:N-acetylglucosamine-6-phosphate deacetylase
MLTTLITEQLFDGNNIINNQAISFEDGKVIAIEAVKGSKEIKISGLLSPGFIDVQVNGGGGYLLC